MPGVAAIPSTVLQLLIQYNASCHIPLNCGFTTKNQKKRKMKNKKMKTHIVLQLVIFRAQVASGVRTLPQKYIPTANNLGAPDQPYRRCNMTAECRLGR